MFNWLFPKKECKQNNEIDDIKVRLNLLEQSI